MILLIQFLRRNLKGEIFMRPGLIVAGSALTGAALLVSSYRNIREQDLQPNLPAAVQPNPAGNLAALLDIKPEVKPFRFHVDDLLFVTHERARELDPQIENKEEALALGFRLINRNREIPKSARENVRIGIKQTQDMVGPNEWGSVRLTAVIWNPNTEKFALESVRYAVSPKDHVYEGRRDIYQELPNGPFTIPGHKGLEPGWAESRIYNILTKGVEIDNPNKRIIHHKGPDHFYKEYSVVIDGPTGKETKIQD